MTNHQAYLKMEQTAAEMIIGDRPCVATIILAARHRGIRFAFLAPNQVPPLDKMEDDGRPMIAVACDSPKQPLGGSPAAWMGVADLSQWATLCIIVTGESSVLTYRRIIDLSFKLRRVFLIDCEKTYVSEWVSALTLAGPTPLPLLVLPPGATLPVLTA